MCEQCIAETMMYAIPDSGTHEVLPGFALIRATKDGYIMKKDDWGLVQMNDPNYWWSVTPREDPWHGLTDEEIDKRQEPDSEYDLFEAAVESLGLALNGRSASMMAENCFAYPRFEDGICLYEAAKKRGYSIEEKTYNDHQTVIAPAFAYWLCHYLAVFLKTAKVMPEVSEAPVPPVP